MACARVVRYQTLSLSRAELIRSNQISGCGPVHCGLRVVHQVLVLKAGRRYKIRGRKDKGMGRSGKERQGEERREELLNADVGGMNIGGRSLSVCLSDSASYQQKKRKEKKERDEVSEETVNVCESHHSNRLINRSNIQAQRADLSPSLLCIASRIVNFFFRLQYMHIFKHKLNILRRTCTCGTVRTVPTVPVWVILPQCLLALLMSMHLGNQFKVYFLYHIAGRCFPLHLLFWVRRYKEM